jgi:hypothetical protein
MPEHLNMSSWWIGSMSLNQQRAYVAEMWGLDYNKLPKNFKEALSRPDSEE